MPSCEMSTANASSYLIVYVLLPRKKAGKERPKSLLISTGLGKG